jgi:cobalt-zinc-cadmium efflux system protein
VLAALANALLIFGAAGGVAWEAITRLADPPPLHAVPIIIVAGIGVVVNAASAVFFLRDRERDVNIRAAFMHLTADAAVSFGVVLAGLAMLWTQLAWIDPAVSLLIAAAIFLTTWNVFRESLDLALDAVPTHIDVGDVRRHLCGLRGVKQVHDLHVWAMSTDDVALTAHLVVDEPTPDALVLLDEAAKGLRERFGIEHSTLQLEPHSFVACPQESHGPCSVEEHHEHAAAGR